MFLNVHSYFSLRFGTLSVDRIFSCSKEANLSVIALTDINNTSACLEFVRRSKDYGIRPIVGVDFRNGAQQQFVALAKSNLGFQNINSYLSGFLHQNDFEIPDRCKKLADTFVIYPFSDFPEKEVNQLLEHEFLGVTMNDLETFKFRKFKRKSKLLILHTVTFQNKRDFNTHRLLRAIDNNTLLSKLPKTEQGKASHVFVPLETLINAFAAYPEIIETTQRLLKECNIDFSFNDKVPKNQSSYTGCEKRDFRLLKKLAYDGLSYRYKEPNEVIHARIHKELKIIEEKKFVSYFLINWKILKYARSKGYFYVGRGSGANSIIAYLLRITDVDPVELDLYFERFINLYRQNPPDFDIDFSWTDRDDIINFIFEKFENTALITVYNTFKYKASVRELGKVFGLPKSEIDKLSAAHFKFENLDELSQLVVTYSKLIQGFPNYLGIHAGGILISEKPIHHYTATFMPPKGFATTQFDMVVAEDVGLYKFDILSQRGLGKIKEAVEIVAYNQKDLPPLDIHDIKRFKEDKRINKMLEEAKAIGCFYVESPAMRMLLKKLRTNDYLGLVAASSVIRPGASKFGMRDYILRSRFPEKRKEAHPVLLKIMPETYGVMVYQEDVIKVAHYFGGLTLAESDVLRRGMSGKFRSREEFLKVKEKFFRNCYNDGKSKSLTLEVWQQIESFAGYAFAKGHSASYAVESYQSLFLKCYFPLEYMVATINNFGGFYKTEFYVHEARMHGAKILPPCVNRANMETVIYGKDIYMGFMFLHAFETKVAERLLRERLKNGMYADLDDFIDRVHISMEQIAILIKINAFRFTGKNKRELLWQAHMKINKISFKEHEQTLFKAERINFKTPELICTEEENAFDEIELLGFSLSSPFDLLRTKISNPLRAKDLIGLKGKTVTIEGYLVTVKDTSTSKGDRMFFGTFLDLDGDFIDTVHFPPIDKRYMFRGKGMYCVEGKVIEEFDCISIEVSKMERLPIIEDPRYSAASNKSLPPKESSEKSIPEKSMVTKNFSSSKSFYKNKIAEIQSTL
ncbi:DNA polymerase III, alpha subunit [Flavobacteriaceae bacterium MAR_2010_188]|nr:DNA polymerase III, alpha subunit [Flavobacteriaceae bacterium MAR_2010_188]